MQYPAQTETARFQAADQRADNTGEFSQIGTFGQVMVGAAIQSLEFVGCAGARGKNDDAEGHFLLTQFPDQVEAIAIRQSNVDDGDGVPFRMKALFEFGQTAGDGNDMTVLRQEISKFAPQDALVFKENDFGHDYSLSIMRQFVAEQT